MAQKERVRTPAKSPAMDLATEEFAQVGLKQLEAMIGMQKVILGTFEQMNRDWLAGAQGAARSAIPNLVPAQPGEPMQRPAVAWTELHKQLSDGLADMNRDWAARITAEMELTTEFIGRLTAARSMPDAAVVFQDWIGQRLQMILEDGRRLAVESQKLTAATTRCFSNGWPGGST